MAVPRLEYGDLSKFLASMGVASIALSLTLPWLFLREDFDLLLTTEQRSELPAASIDVIEDRVRLVRWLIDMIPAVSVILFALGVVIIGVALRLMWRSYRRQERKQILELKELENRLSASDDDDEPSDATAPIGAAGRKAAVEALKMVPELALDESLELRSASRPQRETLRKASAWADAQQRAFDAEQAFVDRMLDTCADDFQVFHNRRLGAVEYDVIAASRAGDRPDMVYDLRLVAGGTSKDRLRQLALRFSERVGYYSTETGRDAKGILVLLADDAAKAALPQLVSAINGSADIKRRQVELWLVSHDDVPTLAFPT